MRYLACKFILSLGLSIGVQTLSFAVACKGMAFAQDGDSATVYEVSWYSGGSSCCSAGAGSALVEIHQFVGGSYAGTLRYYISTEDAQYAAGCPSVA